MVLDDHPKFILCNHWVPVSDATLARSSVMRMLSTITSDHFKGSVISLQRKGNFQDVSARLNDLQDAMDLLALLLFGDPHALQFFHETVFTNDTSLVEVVLHHVKVAWVVVSGDTLQPVRDLPAVGILGWWSMDWGNSTNSSHGLGENWRPCSHLDHAGSHPGEIINSLAISWCFLVITTMQSSIDNLPKQLFFSEVQKCKHLSCLKAFQRWSFWNESTFSVKHATVAPSKKLDPESQRTRKMRKHGNMQSANRCVLMRILSRKYTFFLVKLESLKAVWRMHLSRPKFEHQKEMQFEAKKFTWCWYFVF